MGVQQQYRDYVMTGFVKRVEPVVADHGDGALLYDAERHRVHRLLRRHQRHQRRPPQPEDPRRGDRQANKLVHACSYVYHVESVGALAEKLAEVTPATCRNVLRQRRRRGHRGAFRLAKRYSGKNEFLAIDRASTDAATRPSRSPATRAARRAAAPTCRASPSCPRRTATAASPRPRRTSATCSARAASARSPPAPLGERLRLHRRAGDGRGRHHRAAGRLLQARQGDPRRGGHPLHRRRGPERLRPYRQAVRHRALRRCPRHHDHGQGHRRRLAAQRLHRRPEIADAFQIGDHLSTFGGNPVPAPPRSPTSSSSWTASWRARRARARP